MVGKASVPVDWEKDSQSFDGVADLYETYRPSYPAELIDEVINLSGIQSGGEILEIGSGTGKATRLFAERGFSILCLEPGQNLIDVAQAQLNDYPQVRFERSRFEEWEANQRKFDLLISAQAFHWVPQEVRFVKAASVLKPQGHIALFWNMYPGIDGGIRRDLDEIYSQHAPELVKENIPPEQLIQERVASLRAEKQFEKVIVRSYPWAAQYKTETYLGLLNTYSDHLRLPEQQRQMLFEAIAELIEQHGGQIEKPYVTVLFMARRKNSDA
jgi:ubiquinone/menaquinone biosynthesis C-methylase UbiE